MAKRIYVGENDVSRNVKQPYAEVDDVARNITKGYIGVDYSLLFTPKMLESLTEEQIYEQLLQKISYNDFEYNKIARNKYVGKKPNAFGIDKILYKCPDCHKEHTLYVDNDCIVCRECGLKVRVNEYYDLIYLKGRAVHEDIDRWYKWQRSCVAQEVKGDDFELSLSGSLCTIRLDKLCKAPDNRKTLSVGKAILTNRGLAFEGTLDGEHVDFEFSAKSIYSLTFSTKGFLEFYHNNDYYMIVPDEKDSCLIKWTLASEEIHNLYDERWRCACEDVYDYTQENIE